MSASSTSYGAPVTGSEAVRASSNPFQLPLEWPLLRKTEMLETCPLQITTSINPSGFDPEVVPMMSAIASPFGPVLVHEPGEPDTVQYTSGASKLTGF